MCAPKISKMFTCIVLVQSLIVLVFVACIIPPRISAQVVGATISGSVVDSSGAKMPDVDVAIKNVGTDITTTTITKAEGLFGAPNLQPGNYEITASAKGFSTLVRKGITLSVGQEMVLNLTMKVGSLNEQVTVTADAPSVNLANSTISGVVTERTVVELPLNGRSWTDLAALQPGVHISQNQPPINAGDRVKRGLGLELTISGARPQQNNYMLDGVNINDYANAGPGSVLGGNLGTDAVAEFNVLTTNYSTEYGRTSGGVITATTKSGTNQFHGSAYEFLRNSALDAASFIDNANGNPKPPFRRNQYGASAGGPIQKDKTFVFGDYEGVTQGLGTTTVSNVLTANARMGFINGCTTSACQLSVDPNVARFLASNLVPLPNINVANIAPGDNTGQFAFASFQKTQENFFIVRADHTFSSKDRIFGTYLFDKASQSEPDQYKSVLINNPMFRQMIGIEETHVFSSSLVNSFRVGFNRDNVESPSGATALNPAAADKTLGFIPGTTMGNIQINSDGLSGFYPGALDVYAPFKFHWNSFQEYDNLFKTKGIHSMKFGANLERLQGNTFGADFPGGQVIFNQLSDFLTNDSGAINADVPGTVTGRGVRQWIFGTYFQDDVHLRSNLTLNLGLRYEMASVITEVNGKLSNLRVLNSAPPMPHLGSPYIMNPTKRNFEPRVGFAWDPFKDGKTSVAGGFGMFDVLPYPVEMGSGVDGSYPFDVSASQSNLTPPGGLMQLGCSTACGGYGEALSNQSARYYVMQFNPKRNYVMQWNLNIQRQVTPNTTVMVGYVGAHGVHMRFQADDNNFVFPTTNAQGHLQWPCNVPLRPVTAPQGYVISTCPSNELPANADNPPPIVNQHTGRTQMALWDGQYFYDGLQVQVKKAMSRSFQIEGSYTWSKNIDTGGGSVASDPFRNSVSTLLWFCQACRRGLSDQDQRHNLTVNYEWDIPTPTSFATPLKAVLGNWELGGIVTIASGTPFTPLITGDPLGMGTTDPYQYPDKVAGPGCANPVNPQNAANYIKVECFKAPDVSTRLGNAGRNSAIGPGLVDMDLSLFKNIPIKRISEDFKAQFRTEVFNIMNRPNFNSPNDNRYILNPDGTPASSSVGQITLLDTPSRQIQFALKLTW